MAVVRLVALAFGAYLIGSIPTGLWLGNLMGGVDVRTVGSRKTGATNVTRVLGLSAGLLVLGLDFLKGVAAVLLIGLIGGGPMAGAIGGIFAVVGHNWPLMAGFRGGRGVATAAGAFLALCPPAFVAAFVFMALAIALTRYVSLGSMVAAFTGALATAAFWGAHAAGDAALLFAIPACAIVLVRHADNLERLLQGREHRLGQPMPKPAPQVSAPT
jgi:glycerol-3-phosphate acyltransferase PlsY